MRWQTRELLKCSPLRYMVFLNILCLFVLCVECNRRHSYVGRIGRLSGVRYSGRHVERLCYSGLRFPELNAQVRRPNSCISCIPAHMDASITYANQPKQQLSVRRGRSRTAAESGLRGLDVTQSLSQPTKCLPLTPHEALELTKL